jgi:putative FmdB family regulatory protein
MPQYNYRCKNCQKPFHVLVSYDEYDATEAQCPHCKSYNIERRIGRIRFARSTESRLQSMSDPEALANLDDDPQSLGRMMRQMSSELGEDMGSEFNEVVNRLEAGQSPEQIEKSLPDLADDIGDGSSDGNFDLNTL